ncbi:hypothetical protein J7I42_18370 [Niastella sp. MAH-29]|uniref:Uncharacterized protein n=1 Tax=Niastella soli TaxID=2821487 RepID=A0ABS3YXL0_9BACT|nr:hypothetical protein [Niastella soli]
MGVAFRAFPEHPWSIPRQYLDHQDTISLPLHYHAATIPDHCISYVATRMDVFLWGNSPGIACGLPGYCLSIA